MKSVKVPLREILPPRSWSVVSRRESGEAKVQNRAKVARRLRWLLASTCLIATPVAAADWLGTTSNSWFLAGNWNPATVPTIGDNVTINSGASNPATVSAAGATARKIDLGTASGQSGTLNITGGTLTLQSGVGGAEASIAVGNVGSGTLNISAGGVLTSAVSYIALNLGGSSGTATVTGTGSRWDATSIDVGSSGNGTLNILAGGVVNAAITAGSDNGAVGNVLVSGAGSQLNGGLGIGRSNNGTGTVRYENGATGTGSGFNVGGIAGSTGTLTFDGVGTTYTGTTIASVGTSGTGTLNVLNGAKVTTNVLTGVGGTGASHGTALISGSGSSWSTGNLNVGANGEMTISNGGSVTSRVTNNIVGPAAVAGTVTVNGAGSQWSIGGNATTGVYATNSYALVVGGNLNIQNGGKVEIQNTATGIGGLDAALRVTGTGTLNIAGAGSSLISPYNLFLGYAANSASALNVTNGGTFTSGFSLIAAGTGSTGTATVTGPGSVWTILDSPNVNVDQPQGLQIGQSGSGSLTIANGGTVNVNSTGRRVVLGGLAGSSSGTLNIGAAAASPAAAAGTLNANNVVTSSGATGTINFNHTSNNYVFAPGIQGGGLATVNFLAGTTILTGNNTYTGATNISSGATAQFGNSSSTGMISGNVTNNGAMVVKLSSLFETYGGIISGSGTFEQSGTNGLTLTGDNTYSGLTKISSGTLQIGNDGTTGSVAGNIENNSHLTFYRSNSFTFSNLISGTGDVWKDGTGTMTFTGANTYTGGTTIARGTLRLGGNDRLATAGSLFIFGGATFDLNNFSQTVGAFGGPGTAAIGTGSLTFGKNLDHTFQGKITGSGSFIKQGTGSFTMTADNSAYTGTTTVNEGSMIVNNSLSNSAMTVNSSGTLGGTGTVGATTVNGTIAPGLPNAIGTLNVNGTYMQAANSFYNVNVNPAGASDLVNVTGAANINGGTVRVSAVTGSYDPSTVYTILTSSGARTGNFAGAASNFAFLDPSLTYDANNVYLTLVRNSIDFAAVGITPNQISAGGGLAALGMSNPVVSAALMLTPEQARAAFDSVSGEIHPSLHSLMLDESSLVRDAILGRQRLDAAQGSAGTQATGFADEDDAALAYAKKTRKTRTGPKWPIKAPPPVIAPIYGAWVQGYGNWTRLNSDGNAATLRSTNGGAIGGVDVTLNHNWRFGVATGGGRTDARVDARISSGTIDTFHLAAYGGGRIGDILFRTGAAYSHHDISTTRTIAFPGFADTATASYNASTSQVFGEAAYRLHASWLNAEAFADLAYVRIRSDGFTESGGPAALTVAQADTSATYTTLGVRAQAPIPALGPWAMTARGSLGWQHAFDNVTPVSLMSFAASPSPFAISGVPIASDALLAEAGLDALVLRNTVVALLYTGRIAANASTHAVRANVAVKF